MRSQTWFPIRNSSRSVYGGKFGMHCMYEERDASPSGCSLTTAIQNNGCYDGNNRHGDWICLFPAVVGETALPVALFSWDIVTLLDLGYRGYSCSASISAKAPLDPRVYRLPFLHKFNRHTSSSLPSKVQHTLCHTLHTLVKKSLPNK